MTKLEELCILQGAIQALGKDSYLGPALERVFEFCQSEMRSDIEPDIVGVFKQTQAEIETAKGELSKLEGTIREKNIKLSEIEDKYRVAYERISGLGRLAKEAENTCRELSNML